MASRKPVIHGRDHRGMSANHDATLRQPTSADPATLNVDSTQNVGTQQGVHSHGAAAGDTLVSDGSGGSLWSPPAIIGSAEVATVTSTSIIAASIVAPVAVPWANSAGGGLLDYTAPTEPAVIAAGIYAVSVCGVFSGMVAGARYHMNLIVTQASVATVAMAASVVGDSVTFPGGAVGSAPAWVGGTFVMDALDTFELDIANNSNSACSFLSNNIEIVKIG